MKRVTGIGGIFFKADDVTHLAEWYRTHLDVDVNEGAYATFQWRDKDQAERIGSTVWALFPRDTDYFGPGTAPFMVNYRVEDLRGVLEQLKAEGVQVDDRIEEYDYGRFGWITDPEGHRVELWEPSPELERAHQVEHDTPPEE